MGRVPDSVAATMDHMSESVAAIILKEPARRIHWIGNNIKFIITTLFLC
jgi:hypothetical protein